MNSFPQGPDLYCITDRGIAGMGNVAQAEAFLSGGARIIQLRDKGAPREQVLDDARAIAELAHGREALFFVNDHADLAAEAGADGVHLGQDDESPAAVRARHGDRLLIGVSTHNRDQLTEALAQPVDYIAVGPVFGTSTKKNPHPATGVELVAEAIERAAGRPVVAIGGIGNDNLPRLLKAAPGVIVAAIGAVLVAEDIAEATRRLRAKIRAGESR